MTTKENRPTLELALSSLILGISSIFVVFIQIDATIIAFYRLLIGSVLFGLVLLYQRQSFVINKKALFFASLAGTMLGVDLALWNTSILAIGPGIATILNSLQVFFMAGFGIAFFKAKPSNALWLSLIASFVGVILLCSQEINHSSNGTVGVITGVASGFAFAVSMLAMRQTAQYQVHSLFNTMFYASIAGAAAIGIAGMISGKNFITDDINSWIMMALYGSVAHVFAWYLMAKSLPHLSIAVAGLIMCSEPIVVVIIDVLFLDKPLTLIQIVGAAMTIAAIYIGTQTKKVDTNAG